MTYIYNNHILHLQLTLPLRPRQFLHQQKTLLPRSTPILSPFKDIRALGFRPCPRIPQLGFERALDSIDNLVTKDREELVGVAAAAGSHEEAFVVGVVGDDEVSFGAVDLLVYTSSL